MPGQSYGGIPSTSRFTVTSGGAGEGRRQPPGPTTHMRVRSSGAIRLFWTEEDFTNTVNFVEVDTSSDPASEFDQHVQVREFWIDSPAGGPHNVEVTYTLK